jgi:N-ethylmaleimide reductase
MNQPLFWEYSLSGLNLSNRFVMAPMTRSRAQQPGDIPTEMNANYYVQRATAGLIITEATQISLQGKGYANTPGIYTSEQIAGWEKVTNAVHDAGSKIFLQLWHVGRVGSSKVNGLQPIAPSPLIAKDTKVYVLDGAPNGDATFVNVEEPKEISLLEAGSRATQSTGYCLSAFM